MVHLSVAIGRFFEALLWALARGVGVMAAALIAGVLAVAIVAVAGRALWRRRQQPDARSARLNHEWRDEQD